MIERLSKFLVFLLFQKEWEKIHHSVKALVVKQANQQISEPANIIIQMMIIGEDRRFLKHRGFDLYGILRAFLNNITNPCRQGASTIEQQLVRTIISDYRPSYKRKFKEILLANMLYQSFSKHTIISAYLNVAYFGANACGFTQACRKLNIDHKRLVPSTAAQLVARIKYPEPSRQNPSQQLKIELRAKYILFLYQQFGRPLAYEHSNLNPVQKHQPVCSTN